MNAISTSPIVSGQVNFVEIKTFFDSSWDGLNKSYQFMRSDAVYQVDTNDSLFNLPYEVTEEFGTVEIMVKGTCLDETGEIIEKQVTVTPVRFRVMSSDLVDEDQIENLGELTPSIIEQLRLLMEQTNMRVDDLESIIGEVTETGDYEKLVNKPTINNVMLVGDKTFDDLGLTSISNLEIENLINNIV